MSKSWKNNFQRQLQWTNIQREKSKLSKTTKSALLVKEGVQNEFQTILSDDNIRKDITKQVENTNSYIMQQSFDSLNEQVNQYIKQSKSISNADLLESSQAKRIPQVQKIVDSYKFKFEIAKVRDQEQPKSGDLTELQIAKSNPISLYIQSKSFFLGDNALIDNLSRSVGYIPFMLNEREQENMKNPFSQEFLQVQAKGNRTCLPTRKQKNLVFNKKVSKLFQKRNKKEIKQNDDNQGEIRELFLNTTQSQKNSQNENQFDLSQNKFENKLEKLFTFELDQKQDQVADSNITTQCTEEQVEIDQQKRQKCQQENDQSNINQIQFAANQTDNYQNQIKKQQN